MYSVRFRTNSLCTSIHSCTSIFFKNDKIILVEMTRKSFSKFEIETQRLKQYHDSAAQCEIGLQLFIEGVVFEGL